MASKEAHVLEKSNFLMKNLAFEYSRVKYLIKSVSFINAITDNVWEFGYLRMPRR